MRYSRLLVAFASASAAALHCAAVFVQGSADELNRWRKVVQDNGIKRDE